MTTSLKDKTKFKNITKGTNHQLNNQLKINSSSLIKIKIPPHSEAFSISDRRGIFSDSFSQQHFFHYILCCAT